MTDHAEPDPGAAPPAAAALDSTDAALGGNASSSIIGGAIARGGTFIVSTVLIALAFAFVFRAISPAEFGDLAIAIAIATIAQTIGDVAVSSVAQRLLVGAPAAERPRLQAELVGIRFVLMPVVIGIGIGFGFAFGYDAPVMETLAVVSVAALFTSVASALVTPLNVELRAGRAALVDFTRQLCVAFGLILAVLLSASLVGYGAVYLAAALISVGVALGLLEPRWRRVAIPSRATAVVVAREAAWLGLAVIVNALFLKILTVVASLQTTRYEVGLFGSATRVTEVLAGLSLLMAAVAYPLLNRAAIDEDHDRFANATHRVIDGVLLLIGLGVVVTITASSTLLRVFAGEQYVPAAGALEIQAVAVLFAATTQALIWSLLALRAERLLIVTNLLGLVAIVSLGFALIAPYGAEGAAWAAVGGELVLVVATLVALGRRQRSAVPSLPRAGASLALTAACVALGLGLPIPEVPSAIAAAAAFVGGAVALRLVPSEVWAAARGLRAR